MRRFGVAMVLAGLAVLGSCADLVSGSGQSDDGAAAPAPDHTFEPPPARDKEAAAAPDRAEGLDTCGLVSAETVQPLRTEFGVEADPRIALLRPALTYLGCEIRYMGNPGLAWGVRDPDVLPFPAVDEVLREHSEAGSVLDIEIDGSPARLSTGADRDGAAEYLIAFERDGLDVLVEGSGFDPDAYDTDLAQDLTVEVAQEISANLDGTLPTQIDLLDQCPAADDPQIVAAMEGEAVLAFARDPESPTNAEIVTCVYVNEHTHVQASWRVRADGAEDFPEPWVRSEQEIHELRGEPVRLLGAQSGGEIVIDGRCRIDVSYQPTGLLRWYDYPIYPSEAGQSQGEVDQLRDAKTLALIEAFYDLNEC